MTSSTVQNAAKSTPGTRRVQRPTGWISAAAAAGLAIAATASISGAWAGAATPGPSADDASGRYSLSPAEGGFVRLDRQTGAMTFCSKSGAEWSCAPMADAGQRTADELERLKAENKRLESDKKNLETMLGMGEASPGSAPPALGQPTDPAVKIPTEQDIDQAFDYVEGMVRKFRERVKRLEEESNKDQQL